MIYINDLSEDLPTTAKLFADDTSLFNDLCKISNWAFQCKMSFNPDSSKQAQEVIFSRKIQKTGHPSIRFNNKSLKQVPSRKHLELTLDN